MKEQSPCKLEYAILIASLLILSLHSDGYYPKIWLSCIGIACYGLCALGFWFREFHIQVSRTMADNTLPRQ